jgi:phosphatidylserine/phosphatidylglycerophosphate/cardiolipin synthase-like enzyme
VKNQKIIFVLFLVIFFSGNTSFSEQTKTSSRIETTTACFSPCGGIQEKIIEKINHSKKLIKIAIYDFTARKIAAALVAAQKRQVMVKIVADFQKSAEPDSLISFLKENGLAIHLKKGLGKNGIMHNKFAIFDDQEVFTGSYNWTNSAEYWNWENVVSIRDPQTVNLFIQEFEKLF